MADKTTDGLSIVGSGEARIATWRKEPGGRVTPSAKNLLKPGPEFFVPLCICLAGTAILWWPQAMFAIAMLSNGASIVQSLLTARPAGRHLLARMDAPHVIKQFPVHVTFYAADLRYGVDTGTLSVVGEALFFQGSKTTFSLNYRDVELSPRQGQLRDRWEVPAKYEIAYEAGLFRGRIQVDVCTPTKGFTTDYRRDLWKEIQDIPGATDRDMSGLNTFPPLMPQDETVRRKAILNFWASRFSILTVALALLPIGGHGDLALLLMSHGVALIVALCLWGIHVAANKELIRLKALQDGRYLSESQLLQSRKRSKPLKGGSI